MSMLSVKLARGARAEKALRAIMEHDYSSCDYSNAYECVQWARKAALGVL